VTHFRLWAKMYTALNMHFTPHFKHTYTLQFGSLPYQSVLVHYQKHFLHYINITLGRLPLPSTHQI
ncbi:hypothetical protein P3X46_028101, partial [Hevea brasiliensis]